VCISPALVGQSFGAEQLQAMGAAFEHACRELRLTDRTDRLTDIVANKIIDAARAGETDPDRLYEAVMIWASAA
jgi:hypothetical protein